MARKENLVCAATGAPIPDNTVPLKVLSGKKTLMAVSPYVFENAKTIRLTLTRDEVTGQFGDGTFQCVESFE